MVERMKLPFTKEKSFYAKLIPHTKKEASSLAGNVTGMSVMIWAS